MIDKQLLAAEFDELLLKYHKDDCAENLDALRSTQRVLGTALIKEKALTGSTQAIIRFFDDCKLTHKNVDINNELEHVEFDEAELARHASLLDFYKNKLQIKDASEIFKLVEDRNWSVARAKSVLPLYRFKNESDLLVKLNELEQKLDS